MQAHTLDHILLNRQRPRRTTSYRVPKQTLKSTQFICRELLFNSAYFVSFQQSIWQQGPK